MTPRVAHIMDIYEGWTDELEEEREPPQRPEVVSGVAADTGHRPRREYRERLLRAAVREIMAR